MTRIARFLVLLVSVTVVAYIALFAAAYLRPKSNKIASWKLGLEQIEDAKRAWAIDRPGTTNGTPTLDDLRPYFSDWGVRHLLWTNSEVVDLEGGVYTIGRVAEPPS